MHRPFFVTTLERIIRFVQEHHVMTLATSDDGIPYATPLFYAYDAQTNRFVFASGEETAHAQQMATSPSVAAGIHLETDTVGKVQGLQIRGKIDAADEADAKFYYRRFPYARAMRPKLWRIVPLWMKLTDNRLGFGKKLIWEADPPAASSSPS